MIIHSTCCFFLYDYSVQVICYGGPLRLCACAIVLRKGNICVYPATKMKVYVMHIKRMLWNRQMEP